VIAQEYSRINVVALLFKVTAIASFFNNNQTAVDVVRYNTRFLAINANKMRDQVI
jgi:hypothetical protein